MNELKIGCVVMAAGNAARFGENKLAATVEGKTLAARALDAIPDGLFYKVAVVTQYPEVAHMAASRGFICLKNEHPDWGISHTISLGLGVLEDCDGAMFCVSDQPMLQSSTIRRITAAWKKQPSRIAAAAHDGVRGNPCLFPAEFFPALRALKEDHGGSTVIRRNEDRLLLVETSAIELSDCDTKGQLASLKNQL